MQATTSQSDRFESLLSLMIQRWDRLTERDIRRVLRRPDRLFEIMWERYGYLNDRVARELGEMKAQFGANAAA